MVRKSTDMKRLFIILGGVFAAIIVVAIIFIPRAPKLDKDAIAYIADNLPKIMDRWNAQNLIDRATPELIASTKSRQELVVHNVSAVRCSPTPPHASRQRY